LFFIYAEAKAQMSDTSQLAEIFKATALLVMRQRPRWMYCGKTARAIMYGDDFPVPRINFFKSPCCIIAQLRPYTVAPGVAMKFLRVDERITNTGSTQIKKSSFDLYFKAAF
jgi:hypothetical protein